MSSTVVKDGEGSFIPATQRPDGSWRKARRVKDGYVPQEEVPLYESKGKQWASRQTGYPAGVDPDVIKKKELELAKKNNTLYSPIPGLIIDPNAEAKKKKKKKKKASGGSGNAEDNNRSNANKTASVEELMEKQTICNNDTKHKKKKNQSINSTSEKCIKEKNCCQTDEQNIKSQQINDNNAVGTDPVKRLKNLRKKIREIEALELKIANGDKNTLDKDQLQKVSRKMEVQSEILALELSIQNI